MSLNKGGNKSSSQSSSFYDPNVKAALFDNLSAGVDAANKPYQPYSGPGLNLNTSYSPQSMGYTPLTGVDLSGYMNPYTSNVVNATNADIMHQAQIADQQAKSEATASGAWGGDGASVLRSLTGQDYARQAALADASLRQQGFAQAQGAAQTDIANKLAAAFGSAQQNAQNAQANYAANWQNFLHAQQYPFLAQQLRNQTYQLLPSSPIGTSTGGSSGFNFGIGVGSPSGGGAGASGSGSSSAAAGA